MKYLILFCAEGDDVRRFAAMSPEEAAAQYASVGEWFRQHGAKITHGAQLAEPQLATTVRWNGDGAPLVTDGPFLEGNEVIGGYVEVEVEDLDEALRIARAWPPRGTVEVRPLRDT